MKQATITVPEEIDEALDAYGRDHGVTDPLGSVVEEALRGFLTDRGYLLPFRPLRITPLHRDDGPTDISENHDRYFADGETGGLG